MKKVLYLVVFFGCRLVMPFEFALAQTGDAMVGVNLGHAQTDTVEQQTTLLNDLKAAGVHVIRAGIGADDKGLDLVKRIYARGIKILWIIPLKYAAGVPLRPWRPKEFPGVWAEPAISLADPDQFRAYFAPLLARLEANNIELAGFELGNELNMTPFNGEFPVPGQGKQFGLNDLYHDPEGQQIAKGYLQYLKVLAVLKDIRDHSKLNQHTPILTAGFGAYEAPEGPFPPPAKPGTQTDMVSVNATIDLMRANGLDKLVDAYAVHVYPWANGPGQPAAAAGRQSRLAKYVLAECRPQRGSDGKPCWITEWGFRNNDTSCPVHESDQVSLIEEMRNNFRPYVEQRRLLGLFYYAWFDPMENFGVFRCGSLTQSGRLAIAPLDARNLETAKASCLECIRIRVGLPMVEQGPGPGIPDNPFSEIRLVNGRSRGFSASATSYAIDGANPSDMSGTPRPALGPGKPGSYGASGKWINSVQRYENELLGWVHNETGDAAGQGLKSMSLAISKDEGLSWNDMGQILTGTQPLTKGKVTGEGDCTAVYGHDGYYYAYCLRQGFSGYVVARAPVSDPGPGNWKNYFDGKWEEPGLGGAATGITKGAGGAVARWMTTGEALTLGWTQGGVGLHFSTDRINFTTLPEPLMVLDPGTWNRPAPSELIAYQDLLDAKTGINELSDSWLMVYMYLQPNEGFNKRYLVFRNVDVSISSTPVSPQVGVLLARWYNTKLHDRWSTTAAVPPANGAAYKLDGKSGYLMTVAPAGMPSVELEDCVSQWPGHPDHMLETKGTCDAGHYNRLRTAGWVYCKPQEQTISLYRCYNAQDKSHFASNEQDCERLGKMERLLGYALRQ